MMGSRPVAGNIDRLQHTKHTNRPSATPKRDRLRRICSMCDCIQYIATAKKIAWAERRRSARRDGSSLASLVTPHFVWLVAFLTCIVQLFECLHTVITDLSAFGSLHFNIDHRCVGSDCVLSTRQHTIFIAIHINLDEVYICECVRVQCTQLYDTFFICAWQVLWAIGQVVCAVCPWSLWLCYEYVPITPSTNMMGSRASAENMLRLQHTKHSTRPMAMPKRVRPFMIWYSTSVCITVCIQ